MDAIDEQLVRLTQEGLPLVPRPWDVLGWRLGITPAEVRARLQRMLEQGIIRRLGAVPNHYRIGIRANGMCVWDVPDSRVAAIGRWVGQLECVSHCYERPRHLPEWPYNLFAMVHGRSREAVRAKAARITAALGADVRTHDILFSTRLFKKTGLRLPQPPRQPVPSAGAFRRSREA